MTDAPARDRTETATSTGVTGDVPAAAEPRGDGRRPLATLLAPVALGLGAASLVFAVDDGVEARHVMRAGLVLAWVVAGLALLASRRQGRLGVLALAIAVLGGACAAAFDRSGAADVVHAVAVALLPAAALHLALSLPNGALLSRSRHLIVTLAYGAAVVLGLALWAARPAPSWPLWLAWFAAGATAAVPAHRRYTQSLGLDRQRLQWLGCSVTVVVQVALVAVSLRLLAGWPRELAVVIGSATALVPIALAAGASTRLAARVDRLLVHTVSAAGLTTVVLAVYLVIVLGLGRVPDEGERSLLVLSMAAAAVAALLYSPARDRLSELANRLVYGERRAPDEALQTFGSRLSRAIPMEELILQLAESLKKTMALSVAEVWTGGQGRLDRAVSVPDCGPATIVLDEPERRVVARAGVSGPAWAAVWLAGVLEGRHDGPLRIAPVTHSGELLGLIVVERAPGSDQFDDEDERVLTELARQVGLALHNVQLDSALQATLDEVRRQAEELRASRSRIVATADAERRKIERNLHDGAQQHLVALAVNLRLTRDLVAEDPTTAVAMLDELANSVKETIQELRDLAHGIYPPLLMDSGLPQALAAAAARSPLDVTVSADVGRYPTEVEAAVYFCCLEALQNASKHAPDAHVEIRLTDDGQGLTFTVTDDGPGFDPAHVAHGHGFVNMSDRLGAIGGTVRWDSTPGEGTCVSGTVPH